MRDDASRTVVKLDVMVTAEVPTPNVYVFRAEGGNRLTRLVAVLRPGDEVVRSPCLAYAVRHPRHDPDRHRHAPRREQEPPPGVRSRDEPAVSKHATCEGGV